MSAFARYAVDVEPTDPDPRSFDHSDAYHQSIIDRGNAIEIATLCKTCHSLMRGWQGQLGPVATKRSAVQPILDDPANATHPARRSWELQYQALVDKECALLVHVLWEGYHTARFWMALTVTDRVKHGLHTKIGIDARTEPNGATLAFTGPGIPPGYVMPHDIHDLLPTSVALMFNLAPF